MFLYTKVNHHWIYLLLIVQYCKVTLNFLCLEKSVKLTKNVDIESWSHLRTNRCLFARNHIIPRDLQLFACNKWRPVVSENLQIEHAIGESSFALRHGRNYLKTLSEKQKTLCEFVALHAVLSFSRREERPAPRCALRIQSRSQSAHDCFRRRLCLSPLCCADAARQLAPPLQKPPTHAPHRYFCTIQLLMLQLFWSCT
jgi:hypothetical protein